MKKLFCSLGVAGFCIATCSLAYSAPLDAFLTANRPAIPGKGEFEAAYDLVNGTVDVFNVRDNDSNFAGTKAGDYHGAHVRGGIAVTPRLWVDGAYWERRIDYVNDQAKLHSWQVASQYKFLDEGTYRPVMALRASAWGNYADELKKSSPTTQQGITLDSVNVQSPRDVQYQLDLIGSWQIRKDTELSAFIGAGKSRVSVDSLTATTTQGGCKYNLAFGQSEVVGTLAQLCNASVVVDRFSVPNDVYGINVNQETQYHATYTQAGLMAKWNQDNWQVRAGYQYQNLQRDHVDDVIQSRGGTVYKNNHILLGEVMYKIADNVSLFMRGQYMTNQFIGEIPFAYNSMTAHRFDQRYGILSTGLVISF